MPVKISDRLHSWASDIEDATLDQAERTARLPIIHGHVALMPDAHIGIGATVGSVIPTRDAIIPSAVGVDIGCGMIAAELDLRAEHLPDSLAGLLARIERSVPANVWPLRKGEQLAGESWLTASPPPSALTARQARKAAQQFGTLGSGNHFLELCLDERDAVWIVLHSGSRGTGNSMATRHIDGARALGSQLDRALDDPDLACFVQGTPEFAAYMADMLWAQDYALANRELMMDHALGEIVAVVGHGNEVQRINCHHNFAALERHGDDDLWITRKGAIRAARGDLGVIPGSMATATYIVSGLGNPLSWNSCSHGAGRRYSRTKAREMFDGTDLAESMAGKTWLHQHADRLVDEIPAAYKDIDQVMADQSDLVEVRHELHQILNYKGV